MVSEAISNFKNYNITLVGDFNLDLNPDKDYHIYLHINNAKAKDKLLKINSILPQPIRYN